MTFLGFVRAEYSFAELIDWVSAKYSQLFSSSAVSFVWETLTGLLPIILLGAIFLLFSLVQIFLGRKLIKVERAVFFGYIGFLIGEYTLTGIFPLQLLPWMLGIIIGIMFAIIAKDLYLVSYGLVGVYVPYCMLFGGHYLPESITSITKGNLFIGLAVAAIIGFLFFLVRRSVECIFTSAIGALLFVWSLNLILGELLGFTLDGLAALIVIAVITLAGAIVQRFVVSAEDDEACF